MPRRAFDPRPVVLVGAHAILEPLDTRHAADLLAAGADEETWRYMPLPAPRAVAEVLTMIREAAAATASGGEVAFAIVARSSGTAVGSTRYLDIQRLHRALEIGFTWIGPAWRRTAINTDCKLLLLTHAFDVQGAHRVTLKTDARNERSQRAIERLGATREGVLRRHRVCWDGSVRDTVYYGITDAEWPGVAARLAALADGR